MTKFRWFVCLVAFLILVSSLVAACEYFDGKRQCYLFEMGRQSAINGIPPEACEFGGDISRMHWLRGWQAGFLEAKAKR